MSIDNLIFTQHGFISPRWEKAFNNLKLVTEQTPNIDIPPDCLIWVLTDSPNWIEDCKKYTTNQHRVMVLTHRPNTAELKNALQAGARGYLNSLSNTDLLTKAASAVKDGAIWIPSGLVDELIHLIAQHNTNSGKQDFSALLTPRELEIAKLVGQGMNNKTVAQTLNITERTVKSHLTHVFEKLAVKNRLQLSLTMKNSI
ncbi:response regulator transcription factor [Thiomicrospira microaerophila]|uniref:LuxR C-terminal-related transcriptional regulator n=1 Tax=Thiomicrospira microaerophila TaxID=406020 RepID=UPI00200CF525|nr:response regulator transcription factor [Thiomicrospira microaerophila]UQB41516.1 response regulator transcription factor [Thiomicrospira microaerophila]